MAAVFLEENIVLFFRTQEQYLMKENYYKQYEPLFGSWYIKEKIGEGAYGQVYIIEREELGVVFKSALKAITIPQDKDEIRSVMSNGMTEDDLTEYYRDIVENVVSEFIFMSKLKGNSHIVSYEDHLIIEHEDDIGWDILMRLELLTPLLDHTYKNGMTEDDVIKLGTDMCKALEFCRKYDIIHRDIKPENIFIAPSGDYKLGDFGIAKTVEKTRLGMSRRGTVVYMAPEVFKGEAYGSTVDIYSLGLVMYKFLNDGRTPFMPSYPLPIKYDDREEAYMKRMNRQPMPEPKNGSAKLKKIVMKACSYDPEDRYESAAQMREELETLVYRKKRNPLSGFHSNEKTHTARTADGERYAEEVAPAETGDKKQKEPGKSGLRKKIVCTAAALVLAAAGVCYAAIPKEVTGITGVKDEESIYIGDTYEPEYKVEPDWLSDEPLTFSVADENILTVSKDGKMTAEKTGETELRISAREFTRSIKVTVDPKVTAIKNVAETIRIEKGSTKKLSPELSPKKFADEPVVYYTVDKDIATVDGKGRIKAKKQGKTKLRISAGGFTKTVTVEVYKYTAPAATYTAPQTSYSTYNTYSGGSSGSSSGSSSSGKSGSSGGSSSSGSSRGYFDSSDDEYF